MTPGDLDREDAPPVPVQPDLRGRTGLDPTAILAALSRLSADVILLLTPDGIITSCSEAITDILGWGPEHLIGQKHTTLLHSADDDPDDVDGACRMRHRDGSHRWVEPATTPIRNSPRIHRRIRGDLARRH